ncbi:MFS transporter [Candidatus Bipolaricaulota bacterium]|nr:MFS transporter [Candidatus Bipolaricaulota bacterium]
MNSWITRFVTIWTGQTLSNVGSVAGRFALIWWVAQATGSATVLATASIAAMVPSILLRPFVGVWVDRLNRKLVLIISDGWIALVSLGLAVLIWTGSMRLWHIYLVMLLRSVGQAFHSTAMTASVTLLVPKQHFGRVEGSNQVAQGALQVMGPILGAVLITALPLHTIMLIDVATAMFAILPLIVIQIPQPEALNARAESCTKFWADLKAGLSYVFQWRGLLAMLGMQASMNFVLTPLFALTPLLVTRVFQGDAMMLGSFTAASGLGFILGGLVLTVWGGSHRKILTALLSLLFMGAAFGLIAFAPSELSVLAVGCFFISGVALATGNGCLLATFRGTVHPALQGRIGSLMRSLADAMSLMGLAIAGLVSDFAGIRPWFFITAFVLIASGIGGLVFPPLRNIELATRTASAAADGD